MVRLEEIVTSYPLLRSEKLESKLEPTLRADEAVKVIALRLLSDMQANLPGVCADLDPEFLHDYRIAVRRTRALLGQFKTLFPASVRAHFSGEFKWLGDATSPVRDLDVYLLSFRESQSLLPKHLRGDLDPLRRFLLEEQRIAHGALVDELTSARYKRFAAEWLQFLESPSEDPLPSTDAGLPILDVASRRIWKAYRRVIRQGRAILDDPDAPAAAFHRMRISCKKLRYLLEMLSFLYPKKPVKRIVKKLKRLQDNLGSFQDFEVQQHRLHIFAGRMLEKGYACPDTYLAMGRLEVCLEDRQWNARSEFHDLFEKYDKPAVRKPFRQLFYAPYAV